MEASCGLSDTDGPSPKKQQRAGHAGAACVECRHGAASAALKTAACKGLPEQDSRHRPTGPLLGTCCKQRQLNNVQHFSQCQSSMVTRGLSSMVQELWGLWC